MLAKWYFCCCIKASPSSTSAFLSILEILESNHSDSQMLYLAYAELQHADLWMQIYALPFVLKSLRNPQLPESRHADVIKPYLESLLESSKRYTDPTSETCKESSLAISHLFEGIGLSEMVRALKETAKKYISRKAELESSQIPYLDLREFLPETFILAIAADLCEQNEDFAERLAVKLDDNDVRRLLDDALDHRCGRLAFLITMTLVQLTKTQSQSELKDTFWQMALAQDSLNFELEPDLMECYAALLFKWRRTQSIQADIDRIIEESWTMTYLSQVPSSALSSADPLYRIGFGNDPELHLTLPPVYWKCTLWHLAVQLDSHTTATLLENFWQVPKEIPKNIAVKGRLFDNNKWQSNLKGLASLRSNTAKIRPSRSRKTSFPGEQRWVFESPWIERNYALNVKDSEQYKRYIGTITNPANLIRLIAGISIASEILQSVDSSLPGYSTYCKFIGHAADVINKVYGKWLKGYDDGAIEENTYPVTLKFSFTGITLFAYQQVSNLGTGRLSPVSPESFIKILQDYDAKLSSGIEEIHPQEKDFLEEVFPEVSIHWISDAYPSALKGYPSDRWLAWIPYAYRYHEKRNNPSLSSKQEAALIWRFLGSEKRIDIDYDGLDWRRRKSLHHRALLISQPNLTLQEWDINWDEKESEVDQSKLLSCRIARTLQRLEVLGKYYSNPTEVPENKQFWLVEWKEYIGAVSQARGLDRFTRLFLLEVIKNPLLQDSEDLKIIAYTLLEYGCAYDLQILIEYIYSVDANGHLQPSTSAKRDLQRVFAQSMFDFVEQYTTTLTEVDNQRRIRPPREAQIALQKAELFSATLSKIVYAAYPLNRELLRQFRQIFEGSTQDKCRVGPLRRIRCDVEPRKEGKEIITQSQTAEIDDWLIRSAVFDANRFCSTLFYEDLELDKDVKNLFKLSKSEIKSLISQENAKTLKVLATIVNIAEAQPLEKGGYHYIFNCGLKTYLEYFSSYQLFSSNAQFYPHLVLELKRTNQSKEWWVSSAVVPKPKLRVGDIKRITYEIKEKVPSTIISRRKWPMRLILREEEIETSRCEHYESRVWEPNISALFRHSLSTPTSVFGELDSQKKWVPYNKDLFGLLLTIFSQHASRPAAVLTFVGERSSVFGSQQWCFSTKIGNNFILAKQQFTQQAEDEIEEQIEDALEKWSSAQGLLITVEPVIQDSQIRLRLLKLSTDAETLENDFPDLKVPFDYRNLQWENLFKEPDSAEVEKPFFIADKLQGSDGNWFYHLRDKIPGFPSKVRVALTNQPNSDAQKVDFEVKRWHPTWAVVEGDPLEYYEIEVEDGNWDTFLDRWLNLEKYSPLRLRAGKSISSSSTNGHVTCLTTENIKVQVEIESLSMQPISLDQRVLLPTIREAEVISLINKDRLPLELKVDAVHIDLSQMKECCGVVTRVPRFGDGESYRVVWRTQNGAVSQDLIISSLPSYNRVSQGDLIKGTNTSNCWKFEIVPRFIKVRALWQAIGSIATTDRIVYLGIEQKGRPVAEKAPGQFVFLQQLPDVKEHLAEISNGKSSNKPTLPSRMKNITRNGSPWFDAEKRYDCFRAVLQMNQGEAEKIIAGDCHTNIASSQILLDGVKIQLFKRTQHLYAIDREFNLEKVQKRKSRKNILAPVEENSLQASPKTNQTQQQILEEYLSLPEDLEVRFDKSKNEVEIALWANHKLRVPTDFGQQLWTNRVSVPSSEGPYILEAGYDSRRASVRLTRNGMGAIVASMRQVPPKTLEYFRNELGTSSAERIYLSSRGKKLYYVGPNEQRTAHRFEWGYGKTLLIPNEGLRYQGLEFEQAKLILFYGDQIKTIEFQAISTYVSEEGDNSDESHSKYILNIKEIDFRYNDGRTLYEERKRHSIVHMLYVQLSNEGVNIRAIHGFNAYKDNFRKFEPVQASLDPEDEARLTERFKMTEASSESDKETVIYGRLDEEAYKNSSGSNVLFRHVRLSFAQERGEASALRSQELVFLQAGNIIDLRNDKAVEVRPLNSYNEADIGSDYSPNMKIIRRQFSAKEDVLDRIVAVDSPKFFQNKLLLVSFTQQKNSHDFTPSLTSQRPSRKISVLQRIVDDHSSCLATVVDVKHKTKASDLVIDIELQPGIFFTLFSDSIELPRKTELLPGDTIRLLKSAKNSDKFLIVRASFSDTRYIPADDVRPAVALPKESLRRRSKYPGRRKGAFTIGSLPSIQASPGLFNPQKFEWNLLQDSQLQALEDFKAIMSCPHPKIVCLGKDSHNCIAISLCNGEFMAGELDRTANCFKVKDNQLGRFDEGIEPLSWSLMSFIDDSKDSIINVAKRGYWRYHDSYSFHWSNANNHVEETPVKRQRSPLFFQHKSGYLRLRYTQEVFLKFGFPVKELISVLRRLPHKLLTCTVAGVSKAEESGLWVELSPGRIVEVPAPLLVWKNKGRERPLLNFFWQAFAPGDKVTFQLIENKEDDLLKPERIGLLEWIPGIRKALGRERCFLPIRSFRTDVGALELGSGLYNLTLPIDGSESLVGTVVLSKDNHIKSIDILPKSEKELQKEDVVFLKWDDSKQAPVIVGFESLTLLPDHGDIFWADTFSCHLVQRQTGELQIDSSNLKKLLMQLGSQEQKGYLPITIESVDSSNKTAYFSLRYQTEAGQFGSAGPFTKEISLSLASIVGLWPNLETCLLQCGSGLMTMPIEEVISGLPKLMAEKAIAAINKTSNSKQAPTLIGLHRTKTGIAVGFPHTVGDEIYVEPINTVMSDTFAEANLDLGLVCRSVETMRLYWLPAHKASLANLSGEQLNTIFSSEIPFKAKIVRAENNTCSYISVIDLQKVETQFQYLKIGQEFNISIIKDSQFESKEKQRCLARLPATGVVLECLTYGETLRENEIIAEVTQRFDGFRKLITAVPLGKKRLAVDLPSTWFKSVDKDEDQYGISVSHLMQWYSEGKPAELSLFENHDITTIDRALYLAYYDTFRYYPRTHDCYSSFQIAASKAWFAKNITRREMHLLPAVMAVLVLDHVGENALSRLLLQNIAIRSRRSLHVDVLSQRWLNEIPDPTTKTGLSKRLDEITTMLLQDRGSNQKKETVEKIHRLYDAVKIREKDLIPGMNFLPVAAGLAAALGNLPNIRELSQETEVIVDLLNICYSLPESQLTRRVPLHQSHVQCLSEMLQKMVSQSIDIVLLDPISSQAQTLSQGWEATVHSCAEALEADKNLLKLKDLVMRLNQHQEQLSRHIDDVVSKLEYLDKFLEK